jgi:phage-associated protein
MLKYDALDIAKYIIRWCDKNELRITNLQLQKILFFIQKESIRKRGYGIFSNRIEAWQYGPVVPDVFYQFAGFGAMKLVLYEDLFSDTSPKDIIDDKSKEIIEEILREYIHVSPWDLVAKSHVSNGAWSNSISMGEKYPITDQDITYEISKGL